MFDARTGIPNSFIWPGGFGPNWTVFVNTSPTATANIGDVRNSAWQISTFVGRSSAADDLHLFSRYTNDEFGMGKLAEVRVYDQALNHSNRLAVAGELYDKWLKAPHYGTLLIIR